MARICRYKQTQGHVRQKKSKKENRYVIKVMRLNSQKRGCDSLGSREPKDAPSLFIGH
jgi:hypothetical protein